MKTILKKFFEIKPLSDLRAVVIPGVIGFLFSTWDNACELPNWL